MKKTLALILALVMLFSLVACGKGKDSDPANGNTPGAADDQKVNQGNSPADSDPEMVGDKTLKLYIAGFQNLDPQIWSWGTHACRMGIFEGLTVMNTDFSTRLAAAESVEHNDEYTVWTVKVKDGLTWSDGEPLDANDFFYSFRRIMDPQYLAGKTASIVNSDVSNIILNLSALQRGECTFEDIGVKLVDDKTIEFTLANPCDSFDYRLAESWALPVPQHTIEQYGDAWTTPDNIVVNGPFTLASREEDVHIQLVKNEAYWDAENVALEQVDVYAGTQDQYLAYQAGDINVATISTGNYEAVLNSEYADQITYYDTSIINYLGMIKSENSPLVEHPEIREAISLSIDREVLCESVLLGMRTPAKTLVYPGFADWADEIDVIETTANIEKAQELMAQAGYPNGEGLEPMTLLIAGAADAFTLALAEMITRGTGIQVEIVNMEWAAFVTERDSYHTNGMWGYYSDAWNCGVPFPAGAFVNYQFDIRDRLLPNEGLKLVAEANLNGAAASDKEAAFAMATDPMAIRYGELYNEAIGMGATPEADAMWRELEVMRLESFTSIPLCFSRTAKLVAPTIEGFNGNPTLLDAAPFNFKDVSNG